MGRVNVGGGAKVNALIKEYEIAAGEAINAGDLVEFINNKALLASTKIFTNISAVFESTGTQYINATTLNSSKVLVAYRDNDNSYYGTAIILTINGTYISSGTPVVFEAANITQTQVAAIDSSRVLVTYADNVSPFSEKAVLLSISGTSITAGTPVVFVNGFITYISAITLNSSKVLVSYKDNDNSYYGTAIILTINNTSISVGTQVVFNAANTNHISATTLDSNKALVTYQDGGNSNYGTAVILSISGTSITIGTPMVFASAITVSISAATLNSSRVLIAYRDNGNSSYGTAVILIINGASINIGLPVVFATAVITYISATILDSSKALVAYSDNDNSNYGTAIILTMNGNSIIVSESTIFEYSYIKYISATTLDSSRVHVAYTDNNNSYYGTSIVLDVAMKAEGLATQKGTAGETKKFYDWR